MNFSKDSLVIKRTDSPQQVKKKLNTYFFLMLGFLAVIGLWPLLIVVIFMYKPIMQAMEKDLLKKIPSQNNTHTQTNNTHKVIDKHQDANMKNVVKVDTNRSMLAIVGFIIFVLVVVVYYYIKLNS